MPGLVGVFSTRGPADAAARFAAASGRMLRHAGMTLASRATADGSGVAGRVVLPGHDGGPAPVGQPFVFCHGVIYSDGAPAAQYRAHGPAFVERLEGEFSLAIVDEDEHRVILATDVIGSYPIYWKADASGLTFGADLSAVLRASDGPRRLDLAAVADYMTVGAVMGDRTLADDVKLLDPGTILTYDMRTGQVARRQYADVAAFFATPATDRAAYMEQVQSGFTRAVDRAMTGALPMGLSLSGGLDSRAILSAVNARANTLTTYTLGVEGCADQVIARELSRIAGTRHWFFPLDDAYLRDFLPNMAEMVSITDGMYLSHGLTEMLAISFLEQTGIGVLLRGHGGELAKAHLAWPLHTDAHVYQLTSLAELAPYLSARANYITSTLPLGELLTPDAARLAGRGSADSFETSLHGLTLTPADGCSYLYLRELHRRFTVPSLDLFRTRVDVRLPFVDPVFLRALLAAPPEWRDSTTIHQALTRSGIPRLLRVRNSNTGASAAAGPLVEYVLDKCNTILKRLHVHGYRHYHNFDGWMRRMLLSTVEAELLAPTSRVRAFMRDDALARIVRETREGTADRSYLLQVLLILELWQRENEVSA